ncbi:toll-like receptor 4 [Physella acuta]|uniref:toll-like receptor 4 n=1 Tax=Physella acuta TaxID=109671 RepID=UPI0027DC70B5|nr:toll-like receptor 4 [Physella acuta]
MAWRNIEQAYRVENYNNFEFHGEEARDIELAFDKEENNEYSSHIQTWDENTHICKLCKCEYDDSETVKVFCSNRSRLTDIPPALPDRTWYLELFRTRLTIFNTTKIADHPTLTTLKIDSNKSLRNVTFRHGTNVTTNLSQLILTNNNISTIESGSFHVVPNLEVLSLRGNKLSRVFKYMFEGLNRLKNLDLAVNDIESIETDTFDSFPNLTQLDLSRNIKLGYTQRSFPPRLFQKLSRLETLFIQHNTQTGTQPYPNLALSYLKSLTFLNIDGQTDHTFGRELSTLQHLTHLEIGQRQGICRIKNISKFFFENTRHLTSVVFHYCHFIHIDPKSYVYLKNLQSLRIIQTQDYYDLYKALSEIEGLKDTQIRNLSLVSLNRRNNHCRQLQQLHAKYLITLTHLEELDLTSNNIIVVEDSFAAKLPRSLKRLILRNNKLTLDVFILSHLLNMRNLEYVDLSFQNLQEVSNNITGSLNESGSELMSEGWRHTQCPIQNSYQQTKHIAVDKPDNYPHPYIPLPPNIRVINASYYVSFGLVLLMNHVSPNSSLRELYFSNSFLIPFSQGTLPPTVTLADFSDNYCQSLNDFFFGTDNSLEWLKLRNNVLGSAFKSDFNGTIFSTLYKLKYLDISRNLIEYLPFVFFKGLINLEELIISENKLQILNSSFSHMRNLRFISLKQNAISWITKDTRDELDQMAASRNLTLDLTLNPLPCTCEGLPILAWLAQTRVNLYEETSLVCHFENAPTEIIGDLKKRVKSLQRYCASQPIIIVISISAISLIFAIIALALMYKYRWKLRYLKAVTLVKWVGFHPKVINNAGYKYDAYVLYSDETRNFVLRDWVQELEIKRGHRLCIEERDFMPGTYAISAIVGAVQHSAKTVPVVTPEFYDGEYTEYGLKMALMEEIFSKRAALHLCLYQPVPQGDMSRDLLSIMKRNDFTEFPGEGETTEEALVAFWNQMSAAIGHSPREALHVEEPEV